MSVKKRLMVSLAAGALALSVAAPASAADESCWGALSAAFAQSETGIMGVHSSQQPTPRVGLPNLARALYDEGVIEAPTLTALGVFLDSIDPDLNVDACE